jgi:chromosome segregation ATPase
MRKEVEGEISRVCLHCQRIEARKKAKEELRVEMMEIKAETTRISADNESLKATIDAFTTQITSQQATKSETQLNSLARIRPLHKSLEQAQASREELSPFLSELHLSVASHSACLVGIHAKLTALNSQMKALCDSIDEERKTVHLLERELRERHKKLRFSVPNEPCPHLRQVSPREDERDPLGSLACNLRCLLM